MKYIKIVIFVIIVIAAFYVSKIIVQNIQLQNAIKVLEEKEYISSDIEKKRNLELNSNGIFLDSIPVVYENETKNLFEIIKTNKLVLFISEKHCDICIKAQVENLIENKTLNPNNIIILIQPFSRHYIELFKKKNKLTNTIYECKENTYKSFPDLYEPYFFIIDIQTQRIQSMFIPDKTDPHATQVYLNNINRKYFN